MRALPAGLSALLTLSGGSVCVCDAASASMVCRAGCINEHMLPPSCAAPNCCAAVPGAAADAAPRWQRLNCQKPVFASVCQLLMVSLQPACAHGLRHMHALCMAVHQMEHRVPHLQTFKTDCTLRNVGSVTKVRASLQPGNCNLHLVTNAQQAGPQRSATAWHKYTQHTRAGRLLQRSTSLHRWTSACGWLLRLAVYPVPTSTSTASHMHMSISNTRCNTCLLPHLRSDVLHSAIL